VLVIDLKHNEVELKGIRSPWCGHHVGGRLHVIAWRF
jgi:hypothetical protein